MKNKKIHIVGAGPGGLTAAMILAKRGFDVTVFEKDSIAGGRNKPITANGFRFDTGPTFLMLLFILEDIFSEAGRSARDYLDFVKLDPMYRLQFYDKALYSTGDVISMRTQIAKLFPGNEKGFDKFLDYEGRRFKYLFPCLQKDYSSLTAYLDPIFISALRYLSAGKTVHQNLGRYYNDEDLKVAFTFQSKYLGMSPWKCPALFSMLSYMEYAYGIYHVKGGLNVISKKMADVLKEHGGKIRFNSKVKSIIVENKRAKGLILESGERVESDEIIINADFAYAMSELVEPGVLKKYTKAKLNKMKYSCSTFMMYLGLKKLYDLNHHNIFFARDYHSNVNDIFLNNKLSDDFSFYIQNASVTDKTLAPAGKSTMYILIPVPNNFSGINWQEHKNEYRRKALSKIIERTGFADLESNIEYEHINSPLEWQTDYNIFNAAEFGLSHNLSQMLYWRPHNRFEELGSCYLVGGGTHPGSGLPTIYESGRITANLICKAYGVKVNPPIKAPA